GAVAHVQRQGDAARMLVREGLQALTLAYAVLPCALKLLAAAGLYLAFVRITPSSRSPLAEAP
ncbi:MAG: hypothetical protein ACKOBF_00250, partial [Limnohabitans sp.]